MPRLHHHSLGAGPKHLHSAIRTTSSNALQQQQGFEQMRALGIDVTGRLERLENWATPCPWSPDPSPDPTSAGRSQCVP
eukprot:3820037-Pyramimonas_sp.AAC.1